MFVLSPRRIGLLREGEQASIAVAVVTAIVGFAGLGAGVQNWLARETLLHERIILIAASLILTFANVPTDAFGIIITGMAPRLQLLRTR